MTPNQIANVEEAKKLLDERAARVAEKKAAEEARLEEYRDQLSKMPEYKPGTHVRTISRFIANKR